MSQPKSEYEKKQEGLSSGNSDLASYVKDIFESFKSARRPFEAIWEECWLNYRGEYQPSTRWRTKTEGTEGRSKIFIKITAVKCHTAHAKIMDAAFRGSNDVPFDTKVVGNLGLNIPAEVADAAAKQMKKKLKDHFRKIELEETMDTGILEAAILGTAVLKGPIVEVRKKTQARVRDVGGIPVSEIDGEVNPYELITEEEIVPVVDHIPLWEYYVDPNARTTPESIMEFHYQRLLPADFSKLAYQGGYNAAAVKEALAHAKEQDETEDFKYVQLGDNYTGTQGKKDQKISVLEGWGQVPVSMLRASGCELSEDMKDEDIVEALVVLAADGIVIKACVNPIGRRPFRVMPYKKRPHCIYGYGVAESMKDSQAMINSSARLTLDNKVLSGNGMVAINLDRINTKRTKNMKIYPGKTWFTKGQFSPSDAISSVTFPDVTRGLMELMQMFERFADEETGIPKYTQGEQGSFLNKTATGMSMLMGQANINLKTVMKNIDNFWIEPLAEDFHRWFLEMDPDNSSKIPVEVKATLEVRATGTDSLIAKELKMENYMRFLQITANPSDAILTDRVKLMQNIAELLETDNVMHSEDKIKEIMTEMSERGAAGPDMRESIKMEKLYPLLTRSEQVQVLESLGINPDTNIEEPITEASTERDAGFGSEQGVPQ